MKRNFSIASLTIVVLSLLVTYSNIQCMERSTPKNMSGSGQIVMENHRTNTYDIFVEWLDKVSWDRKSVRLKPGQWVEWSPIEKRRGKIMEVCSKDVRVSGFCGSGYDNLTSELYSINPTTQPEREALQKKKTNFTASFNSLIAPYIDISNGINKFIQKLNAQQLNAPLSDDQAIVVSITLNRNNYCWTYGICRKVLHPNYRWDYIIPARVEESPSSEVGLVLNEESPFHTFPKIREVFMKEHPKYKSYDQVASLLQAANAKQLGFESDQIALACAILDLTEDEGKDSLIFSKKARALALKYHPDKVKADDKVQARDVMLIVNDALGVLRNAVPSID